MRALKIPSLHEGGFLELVRTGDQSPRGDTLFAEHDGSVAGDTRPDQAEESRQATATPENVAMPEPSDVGDKAFHAMLFPAVEELVEARLTPQKRSQYRQLSDQQRTDYARDVYNTQSESEKLTLRKRARELQSSLAQVSRLAPAQPSSAGLHEGETSRPTSGRQSQLDRVAHVQQTTPMDEDSDDELPDVRQVFSQRSQSQQTPTTKGMTETEPAGTAGPAEAAESSGSESEPRKTGRKSAAQVPGEGEGEAAEGPLSQRSVGTSTLCSFPGSPVRQKEVIQAGSSATGADPAEIRTVPASRSGQRSVVDEAARTQESGTPSPRRRRQH